jgi:hypothetical protein
MALTTGSTLALTLKEVREMTNKKTTTKKGTRKSSKPASGNIGKIISATVEKNLNRKMQDAAFRKKVFADPVAVLRREGVNLKPEHEESIVQLVKELSATPRAIELSQMSVARDLGKASWGIGISISWKTQEPAGDPGISPGAIRGTR